MTEAATEMHEGGEGAGANAEAATTEAMARRMGWRPKEEFKGPDEKWRPAEEFVERGLNELPILRDNYRRLDERFAGVNKQLEETRETLKEFSEFSRKADERAFVKAKKELEEQQRAAVAAADTETYDRIEREKAKLEEERPKTAAAPKDGGIDPYVPQWVAENPWFNAYGDMQAAAKAHHGHLLSAEPGLSLRDNLARVRAEMIKRYPERFPGEATSKPREEKREETRQSAAAVSESSVGSSSRNKGKSYADLPPDAKAACDRFVRTIPGFTQAEYVKQFFEE